MVLKHGDGETSLEDYYCDLFTSVPISQPNDTINYIHHIIIDEMNAQLLKDHNFTIFISIHGLESSRDNKTNDTSQST